MVKKVNRFLRRTFKGVTLLVVFLYFTMSLVYTFPLNPIKVGLNPLIALTVGKYFQQNWSLFAPDPVSSNVTLFIAPLETSTSKPTDSLAWIDVTTPLLDHFQENRFSGYERIGRAQTGALRLFMGNDPQSVPWKKACDNGDSIACKVFTAMINYDRKIALQCLQRVGSSICNQLYDPGTTRFALGYSLESAVEWSQRYTLHEGVKQFHYIGDFKRDFEVTHANFFVHDQ